MTEHASSPRMWMVTIVAFAVLVCLASSAIHAQRTRDRQRVPPTLSDVSYGDHPQQKIDLYLAESEQPTPLVLFIHGGGFRGGSKRAVNPRPFLDAGISLAAIEYRFVQDRRLPAAHHDCRRALQFLRHHAQQYNFDKTRIGAFGGSAGAQLCMYLAFHDDMADVDADDPIDRESTRLTCVATNGGQTTMDFAWWQQNVPGYDQPHRDVSEMFDAQTPEAVARIVREISALSLISRDDPPIFMSYGMQPDAPVPTGGNAQGWKVHHVIFGIKLKERMDAIGVEADLQYPGAATKYTSREQFLITKLSTSAVGLRESVSFNDGWRFARFGAMPDGSQLEEPDGLERPDFDDSDWRMLNVPHDWGIEGPFRNDLPNQTGKLPWAGIGWYRKTFSSPESDRGKRVFVDFDGAMSGTQVWLNGDEVGRWPYGYSSFRMELTRYLQPGRQNTIAVRLDNPPESSRWYPGAGIYRNVRLVKTGPVHVAHWGVFVTTPEVSAESATVEIATRIEGPADAVQVCHQIFTDEAQPVTVAEQTTRPGAACTITIDSPRLWDLDSPHLYRLQTTLLREGLAVDDYQTVFGIRTIEYSSDQGFRLNGRPLRMKGVCQHHDLGPLGSAVNRRAIQRQIEILQEMGCNAIRTAHNPPAPELLDLCDRMGMLVQVEAFDCWKTGKVSNDYSRHFPEWHEEDLAAMVRRDRNHPCVVMWSTGNEIREQANEEGHRISKRLTEIVKQYDTTRPVTAGCNNQRAGMNGFQKTVDLFGYNYKPHLYEAFREANPDQPLYGSETASTVSSRGEYFFPVSDDKSQGSGGYFHVSSYDLSAPPWAYRPDVEFEAQDKHPCVFGEFVWTGFDYLGEPTPYNKDKTNLLNFADPLDRQRMKEELDKLGSNIPPRSSYFGIVDLCGFPKDRFYLYQARWRPDLPIAHILPHWNWPERVGQITPVHVYTSGDEVELFLNGKSLGRKRKGAFEYRLRWDEVVYQPGKLTVVAYKDGQRWATDEMRTTGEAGRLTLSADRSPIAADGADLSFVTVEVTDREGLLVPRSRNTVKYTLTGPGEIIAVGNGDPTSHESFQARERKVFNGLALVVIRSQKGKPGEIVLRAESDGLKSAELAIRTE